MRSSQLESGFNINDRSRWEFQRKESSLSGVFSVGLFGLVSDMLRV